MLYLITGLPGSSKTLNLIKFVCEDDVFCVYITDPDNPRKKIIKLDDDGNKVRRPVYCHNLILFKDVARERNISVSEWNLLTDDQAKDPESIESGAVILYDECQDLFPVLPSSMSGKAPKHYAYMNKHRHSGHDVIMITQHPKNLNTQLRRLVNYHIHFVRLFGTESSTRYLYQECRDEPLNEDATKMSETKVVKFDKDYYGVYKSAEVHTTKVRLPVGKLLTVGLGFLALILMIGAVVYMMSSLGDSSSTDEVNDNDSTDDTKSSFFTSKLNSKAVSGLSIEEYVDLRKPRISGIPSTAPIYDELTQPQSFPRIAACIRQKNRCQCYTQQGTKLSTPTSMCADIVTNGYFDHTKVDLARSDQDDRKTNQHSSISDSRPQQSSGPKLYRIKDSGSPWFGGTTSVSSSSR